MSGRVLIAGIGNIFLGDDGFGVEAVRRLSARPQPPAVCVQDFGIRGFDLACALLEPWDLVIMVDATARGGEPGSIYVLDLEHADQGAQPDILDAHGLHPSQAINLARTLGEITARLVLVGCEPAESGGEDGQIGLSAPVERAINSALDAVERISHEFISAVDIKQGVHL